MFRDYEGTSVGGLDEPFGTRLTRLQKKKQLHWNLYAAGKPSKLAFKRNTHIQANKKTLKKAKTSQHI